MDRPSILVYRSEREPAKLLEQLARIRMLADSNKEALGFLPEAAYREAIEKRRLVAMCTANDGNAEIVGFVLFGGVFPNARIQQIAVIPEHRRAGVASALINSVVSQLEMRGYLTVTAAVASDLPAAQAFYERNGFSARLWRPGGQARNRTIIVRARDLATESLLSIFEQPSTGSFNVIDLGLKRRSVGWAPLYAIDLNVMFDVVKAKNRARSLLAEGLMGAALKHQIRLAVAPEFIVELERTSKGQQVDPILSLARQLPRLPEVDRTETDRLAALIQTIVFAHPGAPNASTPQAISDCRHLAQSALARASGYITSDGRILAARDRLLDQIGIDVASLDEFAALLPSEGYQINSQLLVGTDCVTKSASAEIVSNYLETQNVGRALVAEFTPGPANRSQWSGRIISEAGEIVAAAVYLAPTSVDAPARVLVHVRSDHVWCETFADQLLYSQCEEACRSGPTTIELLQIPGQSMVRRAAILLGFLSAHGTDILIKVALGRPVTVESWTELARQTRRRTGLRLPEKPPDVSTVESGIVMHDPEGKPVKVRLSSLEDALGPTILVWPGRDGVVVPIAQNYADDLLGTGDQFPLFGSPKAAFVTRRTYFNSPRTATLMRPGCPILFYESKRSGGRGAVVAAARIVDATIMKKESVPEELLQRAVVEDLEPLSASKEVLATSFDNLLRFPSPVSLDELRKLGAKGSANLQTSTAISSGQLSAIFELGWPLRA